MSLRFIDNSFDILNMGTEAAIIPELLVDFDQLFLNEQEDTNTNVELHIAMCIESQWCREIDEACTMSTSELNCFQWVDWADILDVKVQYDNQNLNHKSAARSLVRSVLLKTDAVKIRDVNGSVTAQQTIERDCCAPLLYCMLGRLSVDQIAGMAYLTSADPNDASGHRLKRAFSEVYYMLMSLCDKTQERNIERNIHKIKEETAPVAFAKESLFTSNYMPVSHLSERYLKNNIVNVSFVVNQEDDRVTVRIDVVHGKNPGTDNYGMIQSLKLLDAVALAAVPEKIRYTYFSPANAFLSGWNVASRLFDNDKTSYTCFCPNVHQAGSEWKYGGEEEKDADAIKITDSVYESWYIARHSADTIRCVLLGLEVVHQSGFVTENTRRKMKAEDNAFLSCVMKNKGKSLLLKILPHNIHLGPFGEMTDVLTFQDRVYLIYSIMASNHLVDGRCSV